MQQAQRTYLARTTMLLVVALALVAFTPSSWADNWNQETKITINEPLEIPGATLQPGKYVVKLVDSQSTRHIVRFFNEDQTKVIATILALSNERQEATGDSKFTVYEMPVGSHPALRGWFFPGRLIGQQFVYPEKRAQEIAATTGDYVPSMGSDAEAYMHDSREDSEYFNSYGRESVRAYGANNSSATVEDGWRRNQARREQAQNRQPARDYSSVYSFESEVDDSPTAIANQRDRNRNSAFGQRARQEPTVLAQNRTPQQNRPYTANNELPDTASGAALFGIFGLVLFAGAGVLAYRSL